MGYFSVAGSKVRVDDKAEKGKRYVHALVGQWDSTRWKVEVPWVGSVEREPRDDFEFCGDGDVPWWNFLGKSRDGRRDSWIEMQDNGKKKWVSDQVDASKWTSKGNFMHLGN